MISWRLTNNDLPHLKRYIYDISHTFNHKKKEIVVCRSSLTIMSWHLKAFTIPTLIIYWSSLDLLRSKIALIAIEISKAKLGIQSLNLKLSPIQPFKHWSKHFCHSRNSKLELGFFLLTFGSRTWEVHVKHIIKIWWWRLLRTLFHFPNRLLQRLFFGLSFLVSSSSVSKHFPRPALLGHVFVHCGYQLDDHLLGRHKGILLNGFQTPELGDRSLFKQPRANNTYQVHATVRVMV